jgi:hypothetical protein
MRVFRRQWEEYEVGVRWLPARELDSSMFGSWKPVSSTRELQLKGASQRGQEPLDTEAEDAPPLEATKKQRTEGRDWEH